MGDAGFYRGVNIQQDGRYTDKEKKLLKTMKFEAILDSKVDLQKVNLDVIKPWITAKLNAILGMEDDVVTEFVFTQLEEKTLNPKIVQINLTGFLNARRSREFMGELWGLMLEAQNSPEGIPISLINKKMEELKSSSSGSNRDVVMAKATENDWKHRYKSLTGGRYGKNEPNYDSMPGAADEINAEPESPSNRRWKHERTPDYLPIPRRKREDEPSGERRRERDRDDRRNDRDRDDRRNDRDRDDRRSDRDRDDRRSDRDRDDKRSHRNRDRSRSRERRRRSRTRSPPKRRHTPSPIRNRSPSPIKEKEQSSSPVEKRSSSPKPLSLKPSSPKPSSPKSSSSKRSSSPVHRRFVEDKPSRRRSNESEGEKSPPPKSEMKKRKRHNSDSDGERREKKSKKSKKEKKEKKHKKDRDH